MTPPAPTLILGPDGMSYGIDSGAFEEWLIANSPVVSEIFRAYRSLSKGDRFALAAWALVKMNQELAAANHSYALAYGGLEGRP